MKKIISSAIFLSIVITSFNQAPAGPQFSKDYYLQKSKNQKTTAWVLLGTGTALIGVSLIDALTRTPPHPIMRTFYNNRSDNGGIWVVALPAGVVADLLSIPFFASANKNKKRAATIAISNQQIYLPVKKGFATQLQPSVTVSISF